MGLEPSSKKCIFWKKDWYHVDKIHDRTTGNPWFYFQDQYAGKDIRDYYKPLKVKMNLKEIIDICLKISLWTTRSNFPQNIIPGTSLNSNKNCTREDKNLLYFEKKKHSGILLKSYSCKNSHWSPFLHNPRNQCLHTTA